MHGHCWQAALSRLRFLLSRLQGLGLRFGGCNLRFRGKGLRNEGLGTIFPLKWIEYGVDGDLITLYPKPYSIYLRAPIGLGDLPAFLHS